MFLHRNHLTHHRPHDRNISVRQPNRRYTRKSLPWLGAEAQEEIPYKLCEESGNDDGFSTDAVCETGPGDGEG